MRIGQARGVSGMVAAAVLALALTVGAPPASAGVTAFKQAVAENAARDDDIAAFYRARNFEPLWTGEGAEYLLRRQALIEAVQAAPSHGLPTGRYDAPQILALMRGVGNARDMGEVEVELSKIYLRFARDIQTGVLKPSRADDGIKREPPYRDRTALLAALETGDPRVTMRGLAPQTHEYARLMKAKLQLEHIAASGGWGQEVPGGALKPGASGKAVVALRNRLIAMGYLHRSAAAGYDAALQAAVQTFQEDHGMEADGVAGPSTIKEINVSARERLESVVVAMERERWLNFPEGRGDRHVLVNLTDFKARIIDHDKVTFETRSVIGHQDLDRRTPEFSDVMEVMVINPSWHVPRSIIVNEYLPLLRSNPGAAGHLRITDSRGRVVSRSNGFSQYTASNFPFAMSQPPGPRNALGVVKFLFPNKYNIYLHDTPAKNLFSREVRTYSHGCIRLGDPKDFAYALLAKQTDDPVGFFQSRLRSGVETPVPLEQPIPVHLIYRTAYTQAKGQIQYRRDVYGRDAKIWNALSAAGVVLGRGDS
ncbi:L,D-transpeptidase family protein [Mesobacterium sp. TK19101]|uniref:L,D-transpeptidase family protein n=1 Tax=Mesobacterium hydrothermale TaxID=3111907 RepID=A0ABU6HCM6_9RHOB|nr:L,D-transpeptidase family protein [Mesobacterium sp. TK19101]MEC3860205.1 L,D-transpeptidase family protein [Mesobacterium sp. TK19101]